MFAIIKTGGKQYHVSEGETIAIEKLEGETGSKLEFTDVLMMDLGNKLSLGAPNVPGAKVIGEIVSQERHDKIIVFKKKRRKNYRRKNGHRQYCTIVKIIKLEMELKNKEEGKSKKAV